MPVTCQMLLPASAIHVSCVPRQCTLLAVCVKCEWHFLTSTLTFSCSYSPPRVDVIGVSVYSSKDFIHWTYQGTDPRRPPFICSPFVSAMLSWLPYYTKPPVLVYEACACIQFACSLRLPPCTSFLSPIILLSFLISIAVDCCYIPQDKV